MSSLPSILLHVRHAHDPAVTDMTITIICLFWYCINNSEVSTFSCGVCAVHTACDTVCGIVVLQQKVSGPFTSRHNSIHVSSRHSVCHTNNSMSATAEVAAQQAEHVAQQQHHASSLLNSRSNSVYNNGRHNTRPKQQLYSDILEA